MENKKLTMREMICYGIGDITANVYLQFIALFAIVFYTDVLGISATLAGLIFMEAGSLTASTTLRWVTSLTGTVTISAGFYTALSPRPWPLSSCSRIFI